MEKYKQITTIKTIDRETGKETITENERYYTIKRWNELTREEKEQEIDRKKESIYQCFQDDLYYSFKDTLEIIKEKYNNIDFNTVYIDSNSQGGWIDSIKNFKCYYTIDIFGETIEIEDVNLHIRKYIDKIDQTNIYINDYYIEENLLNKIIKTKKYKNFINETVKDINNWIDEINTACEEIIKNEYCYPYNLDDPDDVDYLNNYFYDEEFTIYEKEGEK